jgi:hypothetical protein
MKLNVNKTLANFCFWELKSKIPIKPPEYRLTNDSEENDSLCIRS